MLININDLHKFAIEIAVQTIIVLIGLSASIITFTATFVQNSKNKVSCWEKWSWLMMMASIFFGILALLKIVGDIDTHHLDIYETFICIFAGLQILLFFIGLFLLMARSWNGFN